MAADATMEEIVAYLNHNVMHSWQTSDAKITARGTPIPLDADIAVESPNRFRLMAGSLAGGEVDVGANAERFWVWMKRSEPRHMITATHEELARCPHSIPIPFQPQWLMESLQVMPLDPSNMTMERDPTNPKFAWLRSHRTSPQGEPVQQVMVVDTCYGRIVEQSIYNFSQQLVAKATFEDHAVDPATGIEVPHQIALEWPQAGIAMTMRIGLIDVDPPPLADTMWQMPEYPGYPIRTLGQ
jgi:hypothetical protein